MSPSVFVDTFFLKVLDEYTDVHSHFESNMRSENRNQLINILNESSITVDLDDKEVIKWHKRTSSATFVPNDWKDVILWKAFRNYRFSKSVLNFDCSDRIYLLNADSEEIAAIKESQNLFCQGIEYDFEIPISPRSFSSFEVDKEMNGIEDVNHRCRNVIIIDPYLFAPIGSKEKNVPRIPNVIKMLKELYIDNPIPNCHLSILYHRDSESRHDIVQGKLDEIFAGLGSPKNLTITAYGHEDNLFQSNRHVITDYSIMDLQHPFDRDHSSISINFLYDKDIRKSFERVQTIMGIAKKSYISSGPTMGLQRVKFGNILDNELFK